MDESAGVPGSYNPMNLSANANNNTFVGSGITAAATIFGNGNKFVGGKLSTVTIESGAHDTTLTDSVSDSPANITDNGTDTQYRSMHDPATGNTAYNFPGWQTVVPPIGGHVFWCPAFRWGAWATSGTAQALTPTILGSIAGWRAVFTGYWVGPSGYIGTIAHDMSSANSSPSVSLRHRNSHCSGDEWRP